MINIPVLLKAAGVVVALTAYFVYIGQMVPQEAVYPPPPETWIANNTAAAPAPGTTAGSAQNVVVNENGKQIYNRTCVLCHGDRAQGNELFNAPGLAGQEAWYIERQLKNFASGRRGSDPEDVYGSQMRPMAMALNGDQDIADVAAYLSALSP